MKNINQFNFRSSYNFLESTISSESYKNYLIENNLDVAFFCDENYFFGLSDFLESTKDFKQIIGLSLTNDDYSLTMFAKNIEGYRYLNICSQKLSENINNKSKIMSDILSLFNQNIFIIISFINENDINKFSDLFKNNNIFLGVNDTNFNILKKNNIYNISKLIFSNEIRYLDKSNFKTYKLLISIKNNEKFEKIFIKNNKYAFEIKEIEKYISIEEHNKNINEIIKNCDLNLLEERKINFVKINNEDEVLKKDIEKKLKFFFELNKINNKQEYINRINKEVKVIIGMGFSSYFLVVKDIIDYCNNNNIQTSPARGSVAGSLVAFLIGITIVNPLKYDLIFERFLNKDRVSLPDIDIDIQDDRRDEVISYLSNKYGLEKFALISTFQTIGFKNAIRDTGKSLDMPNELINNITKLLPNKTDQNLLSFIKSNDKLSRYFKMYSELFILSNSMIGLPKNSSIHAAGVIITSEPINNLIALKKYNENIMQLQFPMGLLEKMGLIKIDLLGLKNLSIVKNIENFIIKNIDNNFSIKNVTLEDVNSFSILNKGLTNGVFQLESKGMTELAIKMNCKTINDISLCSALYRPGPIDNIPLFLSRKNNNIRNSNINKILDDILYDTFGIIVYQEQIIKILNQIGCFSLEDSDIIRRAISKKKQDEIKLFMNKFINGSKINGINSENSQKIWNYIIKFAEYGFNKSHSISYAIVSYWLLYLKANYSSYFYCELLNNNFGNFEKIKLLIEESKNFKVNVVRPNIFNLNLDFVFDQNTKSILAPLICVKGIDKNFVQNLQGKLNPDLNKKSILYTLNILLSVGMNEEQYKALIFSGSLDNFGINQYYLFENRLEILNKAKLFNESLEEIYKIDFDYSENKFKFLSLEKEYLGFYFDKNPISEIRKLNKFAEVKLINEITYKDIFVNVIVTIDEIFSTKDKNNNEMCFLKISDEFSSVRVTIFNGLFIKISNVLEINGIFVLKLKITKYNDENSYVLEKIIKKIK